MTDLGIVLDLPEPVRDQTGLGDPTGFVKGSFFEAVPEGDTYVLSGGFRVESLDNPIRARPA